MSVEHELEHELQLEHELEHEYEHKFEYELQHEHYHQFTSRCSKFSLQPDLNNFRSINLSNRRSTFYKQHF